MKLDKWYMNISSTIFILQMFFKFDTISKHSKNKNKQTDTKYQGDKTDYLQRRVHQWGAEFSSAKVEARGNSTLFSNC